MQNKNVYAIGMLRLTEGDVLSMIHVPGSPHGQEFFMERRESGEISALLYVGFLADRMLLALDRYASGEIVKHERELVESLVKYLATLKSFASEPASLLSHQASGNAFPAAEYVGLRLVSGPLEKGQREALAKHLEQLEQVAQLIENGETPDDDQLKELRRFLERVAEKSLEQVDERRMRAEVGRLDQASIIEWQTTSKSWRD